MNIGEKLKIRRKELNLTMLQVAKKVGVSEATVSRWESGDIANMRRDKIVSLANALKVSPDFIMGETDVSQEKNKPENIELEKDIIIYNRNGKVIQKKISKEKMDLLTSMIDAIPEDNNPDL